MIQHRHGFSAGPARLGCTVFAWAAALALPSPSSAQADPGGVASPQQTTYSVHHRLGKGSPGPIECFPIFDPALPGAPDDVVLFDGITEPLRTDVEGTVPTVFESESVQSGARRLIRIDSRSLLEADLFPDGLENLGTPLTDACFSIGLDDPLAWIGGDHIVVATLKLLINNQVHMEMDVASSFSDPWDGVVNLTVAGAAGMGINGVRLEILMDKLSDAAVNDRCRDQIEVTDGLIPFTNVGAETDGPTEPATCNFSSYSNIGSDIWYGYTATCTGQITIDLCASNFDTKVALYDGCLECPIDPGPLACNDDAPGCGVRSRLRTSVQEGECYTIRIGGYFEAQGAGTMELRCDVDVPTGACCDSIGTCLGTNTEAVCDSQNGVWHGGTTCGTFVCPVPPPPNDQCEDCIRLLAGVAYNGTTFGATGALTSCGPADTKDVWHCFTADCTGRVRIDTCLSSFDTTLAVYDACVEGERLVCNNDGCGPPLIYSRVELDVTAGTTYYIRVAGINAASGPYRIYVEPCRNACCINNGVTCQTIFPGQCSGGGGRPIPEQVCSLDDDGDGIVDVCETCPNATLADADPPSGTVDARQPNPQGSELPRQGIGSIGGPGVHEEDITILLSPRLPGAEGCFTLCETAADPILGPNDIQSVTHLGSGVYRIFLDRAITAGAVTTITYEGDGSQIHYISHPANVNSDSAASPADILDIVDHLNGVLVPPLTNYQCDLDRSLLCAPPDILTVVDLLNGAGVWIVWNGTSKPVNTSCP